MKKTLCLLIVTALSTSSCVTIEGGEQLFGSLISRQCGFDYEDFKDNGDGTVTDTSTGLTWKKCAEGGNYSNGKCTYEKDEDGDDSPLRLTRAEALIYADKHTYASYSDWRLPSFEEFDKVLLGCKERDSKKSDGFIPRKKSGWESVGLHTIHAASRKYPKYNDYKDKCYGQQGLSRGPGRNWTMRHTYEGQNHSITGTNREALMLVRSDTPSEEYIVNKDIAYKFSDERKKACKQRNKQKKAEAEAFHALMYPPKSSVRSEIKMINRRGSGWRIQDVILSSNGDRLYPIWCEPGSYSFTPPNINYYSNTKTYWTIGTSGASQKYPNLDAAAYASCAYFRKIIGK